MLQPEDERRRRLHDPANRTGVRFSPAPSAAALLGERRISLALRSGAALLFGLAFLWPTLSEAMLFRLFAAYAIADGILALAPGGWAHRRVWPLLIGGCIDIAAAAAVYGWPGMTLTGLTNLAAIWAVAIAASFAAACWTLREADDEYLLLLSGIASLIFGRALMSQLAGGDVVVLSAWTGLYALTMAVLFLKLTLKHYRLMLLD
jgi:uncharacterized membrane protein HdeD (DUF308 family)